MRSDDPGRGPPAGSQRISTPRRPSTMPSRARHPRSRRDALPMAVVVAIVATTALASAARADAMVSAVFDAEAHARDCQCAAHCRGPACCCGGGSSSRRTPTTIPVDAPVSRPTPTPSHADKPADRSGPCLGQVPCGDPAFPTAAPVGSHARIAAMTLSLDRWPTTTSSLLPPPDSCRVAPRSPSRIDRPPRG